MFKAFDSELISFWCKLQKKIIMVGTQQCGLTIWVKVMVNELKELSQIFLNVYKQFVCITTVYVWLNL